MFFSKGCTMIYAGQERLDNNKPSLFDIDKVNWDGPNISNLITTLAKITKDKAFSYGFYSIKVLDIDVFVGEYLYLGKKIIGIFNIGLEKGDLDISLLSGKYTNLIDNTTIEIVDEKLSLSNKPLIFWAPEK